MRQTIVIAIKFVVFLPICAWWLWWSYSMRASIAGGFYRYSEALSLVIQMALITTALTAVVWAASPHIHRNAGRIGIGLRTVFETGLVLVLYTSAVFIWREHWTPAKGMSDSAAFMPVVGHVNAAFFAEELWLEYLVAVIPAMSILSGVLSSLTDAYIERGNRYPMWRTEHLSRRRNGSSRNDA